MDKDTICLLKFLATVSKPHIDFMATVCFPAMEHGSFGTLAPNTRTVLLFSLKCFARFSARDLSTTLPKCPFWFPMLNLLFYVHSPCSFMQVEGAPHNDKRLGLWLGHYIVIKSTTCQKSSSGSVIFFPTKYGEFFIFSERPHPM